MISVVLADDEALLRRALASLLPLEGEFTVVGEAAEGYSVAEIASRLYLAQGTVRNYLSSAMQKTQTRTRHEAARYAREHDWL